MSHFPRLAINLGRSNSRVIHSEPPLASSARVFRPPGTGTRAKCIPLQDMTALKPWFRTAGADASSAPARYFLALATVLVAVIVHIFLTPGLGVALDYLIFYAAAFFVAWLAGRMPALCAITLMSVGWFRVACVFRWRGARIRSPVAVGHVGPKRNRDDRGRRSAPERLPSGGCAPRGWPAPARNRLDAGLCHHGGRHGAARACRCELRRWSDDWCGSPGGLADGGLDVRVLRGPHTGCGPAVEANGA